VLIICSMRSVVATALTPRKAILKDLEAEVAVGMGVNDAEGGEFEVSMVQSALLDHCSA